MFIKPLVSMYVNVPFSETKAYIYILRKILEFKVILAVIRFPGYANHYKNRIFDYQNTHSKS